MEILRLGNLPRIFRAILLSVFVVLLIAKAISSLGWRMQLDTPLLHYAAFLMDRFDRVPYRDIFETSLPGTFAFHYAVVSLFGYGDGAFRAVDLFLLVGLLAVTVLFMRRFGTYVAFWSATVLGLLYLSRGEMLSLQRDYIGTLPVALSLLLVPPKSGTRVGWLRFSTVGILFGLAVLVKPHLGIALPVVFGTLLLLRWDNRKRSLVDATKCTAYAGGGFLAPILVAVIWMAARGALSGFSVIFFEYLPLHNLMTGLHEFIPEADRPYYLFMGTLRFGGLGVILTGALFAYYRTLTSFDGERGEALSLGCLALCTVAYAVYPSLAGKFWPYHYLPFVVFSAMSLGLCVYGISETSGGGVASRIRRGVAVSVLVTTIVLQLPLSGFLDRMASDFNPRAGAHAPLNGRVDEMTAWLRGHLRPGDTVQPLDWTGGSIHAMLRAEAELATSFMYDYHFYHHLRSPVTQKLRRAFLSQLSAAAPRFIIEVLEDKPWVAGVGTSREFPALRAYLARHYATVHRGDGYLVYERRSS